MLGFSSVQHRHQRLKRHSTRGKGCSVPNGYDSRNADHAELQWPEWQRKRHRSINGGSVAGLRTPIPAVQFEHQPLYHNPYNTAVRAGLCTPDTLCTEKSLKACEFSTHRCNGQARDIMHHEPMDRGMCLE